MQHAELTYDVERAIRKLQVVPVSVDEDFGRKALAVTDCAQLLYRLYAHATQVGTLAPEMPDRPAGTSANIEQRLGVHVAQHAAEK
jgi:hypothetical protein